MLLKKIFVFFFFNIFFSRTKYSDFKSFQVDDDDKKNLNPKNIEKINFESLKNIFEDNEKTDNKISFSKKIDTEDPLENLVKNLKKDEYVKNSEIEDIKIKNNINEKNFEKNIKKISNKQNNKNREEENFKDNNKNFESSESEENMDNRNSYLINEVKEMYKKNEREIENEDIKKKLVEDDYKENENNDQNEKIEDVRDGFLEQVGEEDLKNKNFNKEIGNSQEKDDEEGIDNVKTLEGKDDQEELFSKNKNNLEENENSEKYTESNETILKKNENESLEEKNNINFNEDNDEINYLRVNQKISEENEDVVITKEENDNEINSLVENLNQDEDLKILEKQITEKEKLIKQNQEELKAADQNLKNKDLPNEDKLEKIKEELEKTEKDLKEEKIEFMDKSKKEEEFCGLNYKRPIRINKKTVYKQNSKIKGLITYLKLDSDIDFDYSGNSNNGYFIKKTKTEIEKNNYFKNDSYYFIKDFDKLSKLPLSISFKINYNKKIEDSNFNCPLILKGDDDLINKSYKRFPGIYLSEKTGQIFISFSLTSKKIITISSISLLSPLTTHIITLIITESKINLFINGILDTIKKLNTISLQINNYNLFIGNHPIYLFTCKINFLLTQFKIFEKELDLEYIQSEAFGIFGNFIEPAYLILGCINCRYKQGIDNCQGNYHFCLNTEFFSGVFLAVKKMGWDLLSESKKFIYDSTSSDANLEGTAVCCRNY